MNKPIENGNRCLQDKYLADLAYHLDKTLCQPIKTDIRLKDLEPLPYIVWKDGKLVKFEDTLPTTRSGRSRHR